jgi:hypothetical protein
MDQVWWKSSVGERGADMKVMACGCIMSPLTTRLRVSQRNDLSRKEMKEGRVGLSQAPWPGQQPAHSHTLTRSPLWKQTAAPRIALHVMVP